MSDSENYIDPEVAEPVAESEQIAADETAAAVPENVQDAESGPDGGLAPLTKEGRPAQKRGPKKGKPRTPAQKAALSLAQQALREKRETVRKLREDEKELLKQATIAKARAKKVCAQGKVTEELSPILNLMSPFLELSRQQQNEIEHLRSRIAVRSEPDGRNTASRRRGGRVGASARYEPYQRDSSVDDYSEDDARQLSRPSHRKSGRKSGHTNKSRSSVVESEASAADSDFVPIQRAPPAEQQPANNSMDPNNAAAASLARFMNDLGY